MGDSDAEEQWDTPRGTFPFVEMPEEHTHLFSKVGTSIKTDVFFLFFGGLSPTPKNNPFQARHNHYKEVADGIDAGAPIDGANEHGNTLLHIACQVKAEREEKKGNNATNGPDRG